MKPPRRRHRRTGSGGGGRIWRRPDLSEQSDGAGEASHASLGAQREPGGRQGGAERRVQMVDNPPRG